MNNHIRSGLDALVVTPPLSPSDTNPPLGPAVLVAAARTQGLQVATADLNAAYLSLFARGRRTHDAAIVGDQDKDRALTHAAREHFLAQCPIEGAPLHCPPQANAKLGMHYSFNDIWRAVDAATRPGHFVHDFIARELFEKSESEPRVLGLSIMGPPGLFYALAVAAMAKERWPETLVVAGGSHVTLLIDQIVSDNRYGKSIDAFMPHHCENEFAQLLRDVRSGCDWRVAKGVVVAGENRTVAPATGPFDYVPYFDEADLRLFDQQRLTAPLQFTRGCRYGKCAHCTYPQAEPILSRRSPEHLLDVCRAGDAIEAMLALGFQRVSIKDSYLPVHELMALAREILRRGIVVEWSATTMLKEKLVGVIPVLARSGLRTLEFGLESTHDAGQRLIHKVQSLDMVEAVVAACAESGVVSVVNLIYGLPGESIADSRAQLQWLSKLQGSYAPGMVVASHNLLEINLGAPLAGEIGRVAGIELMGLAPWAFSFDWNASADRELFNLELNEALHEVSHA